MIPEVVVARRERVVEMTRQGCSAAEISAVLGITPRSVVRHRKQAGITRGTWFDRMPQADMERAEQLFDDGCSIAEVARTVGHATSTIRKHFPGRGWSQEQFSEYMAMLRRCKVQMAKHEGVFVK